MVVPGQLVADRLPQRRDAGVGHVAGLAALERVLGGLAHVIGRREAGLADVQPDDRLAEAPGEIHDPADSGAGHPLGVGCQLGHQVSSDGRGTGTSTGRAPRRTGAAAPGRTAIRGSGVRGSRATPCGGRGSGSRAGAVLGHDRHQALDRRVAAGARDVVDAAGTDPGRAEDVGVGVDDHGDLNRRGSRRPALRPCGRATRWRRARSRPGPQAPGPSRGRPRRRRRAATSRPRHGGSRRWAGTARP